jgi:hypothetical protein
MAKTNSKIEEQCARLIADVWRDDELKNRFITQPKEVLSEYGIMVPEKEIIVLEDNDEKIHIVIPQLPGEISDDDLAGIAAGGSEALIAASPGMIALLKSIAGSLVSDKRLKTNIHDLDNALNKVLALRGISFRWNMTAQKELRLNDRQQIGFVAQEVEQVIPEVVDSTGEVKSIQYANLVALLVEAVKEQQAQLDDLRQRLRDPALTARM